MSDKRQIRKSIKNLQRIKTWQLVILLILMMFVAATFLRLNNVGMIQRRDAIHAADEAGDQDAIQARIFDLQRFSAAHMNADSGAVYLQGQYDRDAEKAIQNSSQQSGANATLNAQAEAVCRPRFSGYSQAYLICFVEELSKHPGSDKLPEVKPPNPALYRYSFVSPIWSPDFAGWSVLACIVLVVIIVARLISLGVLKLLLRRHYRDA